MKVKSLWYITYPLCAFGTIAIYEWFRWKVGFTRQDCMLTAILFTCYLIISYLHRIILCKDKKPYDIVLIGIYISMIILEYTQDVRGDCLSVFFGK